MPRASRSSSSRAKEPEPTTRKTRGASSGTPASAKKTRTASPSPSPAKSGRSRGRSATKKTTQKAAEVGQGDVKTPTRATRAAVSVTPPPRGRSASKKQEQHKTPTSKSRSSSAKGSAKKATPQKKQTPKSTPSKSKSPAAKNKTPAKTTPKKTPKKTPQKKTPKSASRAATTSRSRSRDTKAADGMPAAQVLLTKIDSPMKENKGEDQNKAAKKSLSPEKSINEKDTQKLNELEAEEEKNAESEEEVTTEESRKEDETPAGEQVNTGDEKEKEDVMETEPDQGSPEPEIEAASIEAKSDESALESKTSPAAELPVHVPEHSVPAVEMACDSESSDLVDAREQGTDQDTDLKENPSTINDGNIDNSVENRNEEKHDMDVVENSIENTSVEKSETSEDDNLNRKRKLDDLDDVEKEDLSIKKCKQVDVVENGTTESTFTSDEDVEMTTMTKQEDEIEDMDKEYVVVQMEEVPAPDSAEVLSCVPKPKETVPTSIEAPCTLAQEPEPSFGAAISTSQDVSASSTNVILNRKFIPNPAFASNPPLGEQFTVVSYNILAQCHLDRSDYSFSSPEVLSQQYRHELLMTELKYLDGDIVCLQEVGPSYFQNMLLPAMNILGYQGFMKKRVADYYDEGEAILYKTSKFTLEEQHTYSMKELIDKELDEAGVPAEKQGPIKSYLDLPDVLLLAKLRYNITNKVVTVANVHINWGQMKIPDAQCMQIVCAIKELVEHAGGDVNPRILCGDFNSEVTSAGYQLATEGYVNDDVIKQLQALENIEDAEEQKTALINQCWKSFQHTSDLKSSYLVSNGAEPTLTSLNKVMRAAVDYIFYGGKGLEVAGVLQTAPEENICRVGGIPDQFFPSDHVSMKTYFALS